MSLSSSRVRKSLALLLCVLLLAHYAEAATFTVGGSKGWTLGQDYRSWAAKNRLRPNDSLYFKYDARLHNVLLVSKSDFNSCNTRKPMAKFKSGKDSVKFSRAGTYYLICGVAGHCSDGMKVAVTVR